MPVPNNFYRPNVPQQRRPTPSPGFYPQQRPAPMPPAPAPAPAPAPIAAPAAAPQTIVVQQPVMAAPAKAASVMDYLLKHPIAPALGAALWAVSQLAKPPVPPTVPTDLPDALKAQWQMVYAQNLAAFQQRMGTFESLGEVLLGYTSLNGVIAARRRAQ